MKTLFIGIDPGKTGSLATLLEDDIHFSDPILVKVGKKTDFVVLQMVLELEELIQYYKDKYGELQIKVGIEKVGAMPGQGVVSMFSFGVSFGIWRGVLAGLKLSHEMILPNRWKKGMCIPPKSNKDESRQLAIQLFPHCYDDLKRKKDNGRADALLIAEYLRRTIET